MSGERTQMVATVELSRTVNVKFDVQKLLDEWPEEWATWRAEKDEDETDEEMLQDYVRETVAEIGWDLLDFNDWVIPEPQYDEELTDTRFRGV